MTDEERIQQFAAAYQRLCEQFGCQMIAWPEARQLGPVIQVEIHTSVQLGPTWTPEAATDKPPNRS